MRKVCILTDGTAQFLEPDFPGHELVHTALLSYQTIPREEYPLPARAEQKYWLSHPDTSEFLRLFTALSLEHGAVLAIIHSSALGPAFRYAKEAAANCTAYASIQVIDSHTTAVGLGLITQCAAKLAAEGASLQELERLVRATIPSIYSLFCIPKLTYLAEVGYLSPAQAIIGEMIGLMPIYSIEGNYLIPLEKVRTHRHLIESFQEFMDEFTNPSHVALVKGNNLNLRIRPLREFVKDTFPHTPFSEHTMGRHLTTLIGPQSVGLFILDKAHERST